VKQGLNRKFSFKLMAETKLNLSISHSTFFKQEMLSM